MVLKSSWYWGSLRGIGAPVRIKFSLPRCSTSPDDMVRLYPRLHWLDQEQSNILLSRRTDREDGTEEGTDTGMSSSTGICHFRFKHWLIKWNIQQRQQYQLHNVFQEAARAAEMAGAQSGRGRSSAALIPAWSSMSSMPTMWRHWKRLMPECSDFFSNFVSPYNTFGKIWKF